MVKPPKKNKSTGKPEQSAICTDRSIEGRRPRLSKVGNGKHAEKGWLKRMCQDVAMPSCAVNQSENASRPKRTCAYDWGRSFAGAASLERFSLSFTFQKCISRLRRRPFFLDFSEASPGGFSSWFSLLRSELGPPTSLERLAKLVRLEALAWLVRRVPAPEKDAARSVERRARGKKEAAEKRLSVLVMVDALLVKDGTSSTDA